MLKFSYQCCECQRKFSIEPYLMVCPDCQKNQQTDQPLRGLLEVLLEGEIDKSFDILDFLPFKEKKIFKDIPVGNTPLWKGGALGEKLGLENLFIKDDTSNLTNSYKDRASLLVGAHALHFGIKDIVVASTGNAGSSMAGVGAALGLNVKLFLPKRVPKAKMVQSLQYGAKVVLVDGTYDDAYDLSLQYSEGKKVLNRNTGYNPMTIEGKKTAALEIFKQLGDVSPDYIFIPTGDGVILVGIYKGFLDLLQFGLIKKIPIMYAVQPEASNVLYLAHKNGQFVRKDGQSIADSISVNVPRCGHLALKLTKQYAGRIICVSDEQILKAQIELSSSLGLFSEPAGAASLAGLKKEISKNKIDKRAKVVLMVTGNGLKDIVSAQREIDLPSV